MHFTVEHGIALVVGILLGFILCRLTRVMAIKRDTGPHNV